MPPLRYWPFAQDLGSLTKADIDGLMTNQVPEGPFVEYKGGQTFDKIQTVRSVAAFANSPGGGTLVIGVEENNRLPAKADGITQTPNLDEQIVQTIRSNIAPVPDFDIQPVTMSPGHVCVVIRVPEGPQSPYVTTRKGEVLVRTQVGTEPIKDRATLVRCHATFRLLSA